MIPKSSYFCLSIVSSHHLLNINCAINIQFEIPKDSIKKKQLNFKIYIQEHFQKELEIGSSKGLWSFDVMAIVDKDFRNKRI